MTLAEFWESTPRETLMFIKAAAWRAEEHTRTALWHAHWTAVLAGANFSKHGVPKLESIMPPRHRRPPRPMTIAEEVAHWERWAAQYPQPEHEREPKLEKVSSREPDKEPELEKAP